MDHPKIIDNDFPGSNIHTAVVQRGLTRLGEEGDCFPTRFDGERRNLREMLMEALHPEPAETDLRYLSLERACCGRIYFDIGGLDSRLAYKGISKTQDSGPRHG